MKLIKSLPTQSGTAFFDRYANLIHTLTKFGVIAQIITGVAEIGIIYSLIYPSFSDLFPSVAHPLSITGSLLAASLLQVGLKLVFPYSVRAAPRQTRRSSTLARCATSSTPRERPAPRKASC